MKMLDAAAQGRAMLAAAGMPPTAGLAWQISNTAPSRAEVYLYGAVDGWELDGNDLARQIRGLDVDGIDLRVNSPGGYVFDAVAVYTALVEHRATVDVRIDGLAASAASFIAQAGNTRSITKPGRMMIHDAQGGAIGGPATLREMADILDAISDDIAGIYADRAGGTPAQWRARMSADTWYSSAQALDAHLVDEVTGGPGPDNRTRMIRARNRAHLTALKG